MSERKYSLSEVDRLRQAIKKNLVLEIGWLPYNDGRKLSAEIEDRARTYMAAGVGPEEIEENNSKLELERNLTKAAP